MLSIFKKKNRTSFKSASSSAYSSPPNAQYAPLAKKYTMYDSMATLVTILSAGNGLISLVNGIQWFAAGGSYIPHLDAVEVLVGAIMLMVSFSMMMVLFTKLRVSNYSSSALMIIAFESCHVTCGDYLWHHRFCGDDWTCGLLRTRK